MSRSLPIIEQRDTKFLLNSWALLVTIGSDCHQSQALSRSYSSNWPNSLNYHTSMAIGYSPRRPDAVIGTDTMLKQSSLHGSIQQPLAQTNLRFAPAATNVLQLTCSQVAKPSHTGKKSLPFGIRSTDKTAMRRRTFL